MRFSIGISAAFLLLICFNSQALSQSDKEPSGSVRSRVTIDGKAAAGVSVALIPYETRPRQQPAGKATTDAEGYFQMTGIRAGRYILQAFAPAMVAPSHDLWIQGKVFTIAEDESVEWIELALRRGGAITGRVTDADGRPVVEEYISLIQVEERNKQRMFWPGFSRFQTDDRGVYRIYGLPPGRYIVGACAEVDRATARMGFGGNIYARTYHPDATNASRAAIIDLTAGGEATGIDIRVGRPMKSYTVAARVLDAATGAPVAGATCGYGPLSEDGKRTEGHGYGPRSDSLGNVRMDGLMPGRYAAFAYTQTDQYSDTVVFEIKDADVSGLEIKLHRGGSISGVAVIEGANDPEVMAKFSQVQLYANVNSPELVAPRPATIKINTDGSFRLGGLPPGQVSLWDSSARQSGFGVLRLERDGAEIPNRIEIARGSSVTGIRVVMALANARIRGQVKFEGGRPPEGVQAYVVLLYVAEKRQATMPTSVDDRGKFTIENLLPIEYELWVIFHSYSTGGVPRSITQRVNVVGSETEVTIVVDLSGKGKDGDR